MWLRNDRATRCSDGIRFRAPSFANVTGQPHQRRVKYFSVLRRKPTRRQLDSATAPTSVRLVPARRLPTLDRHGDPTITLRNVLVATDFSKPSGDRHIDVIVMGTHGRGALTHLMLGSVAERVVRLAPCPVLTVRHPEREFIRPDTPATVVHAPQQAGRSREHG